MFTEVVKAEYVDGYRIRLWFNNHVTKVVDLRTSLKGKVFEPLKDLNFFKRFTVKYNTIEWENGADFAPICFPYRKHKISPIENLHYSACPLRTIYKRQAAFF